MIEGGKGLERDRTPAVAGVVAALKTDTNKNVAVGEEKEIGGEGIAHIHQSPHHQAHHRRHRIARHQAVVMGVTDLEAVRRRCRQKAQRVQNERFNIS